MGKDRRVQQHKCLVCDQWTEDESELCLRCEADAVKAMWGEEIPHGLGTRRLPEYDDPLDQARASSMEGGE